MKKGIFLLLFFLTFKLDASINNLNWLEISQQRFAPQIMFDFSETLYFEKRVDKENLIVELAFPGMDTKDFLKHDIISKLKGLKNIVKNVEVIQKAVPSPRVILSITFVNKDILIRWSKMEDPHRLILDIFSKKALGKLKNKGSMLLYAHNDSVRNDFGKNINTNNLIDLRPSRKKSVNIVVDAGHGGEDQGACGFFFLKEKDITLDVARRTGNILKKGGYKIFLTRNSDKNLTLLERSELAGQLKADLFLSIHVNAVQGIERINGIETYCLKGDNILPPERIGGFLFADNNNKDKALAQVADNLLKSNIDLSKKLALSIQNNVIEFLNDKNLNVFNRGMKAAQFRILLRSQIPVALIEIGFLTNRQEAKMLADASYRQMLAEGIAKGIKQYLDCI